MPLTVTPTLDTTNMVVSVQVSGGTPPYALTATPVGAPEYQVRGTWSGAGSTLTLVDGDVRLNVAVQYSATDAAAGSASASPVTLTSTTDVLSDALDYTQVRPVVVVSQPPNVWEARSRFWDVIGREDPAVSAAPMRLRAGDLVLRVAPADRAGMEQLLLSGNPLLLRSVYPDAVDDVVLLVTRLTDALAMTDNPSGPRHFTLSYQAVSRKLGAYIPDSTRTYTTLLADAATFTDVLVKFATYDDVRTGRQR